MIQMQWIDTPPYSESYCYNILPYTIRAFSSLLWKKQRRATAATGRFYSANI